MSISNSPIDDFNYSLRDDHEHAVTKYFEDLVHHSQVDEHTNFETVADFRELEESHNLEKSKRKQLRIFRFLILIAIFLVILLAFLKEGIFILGLAPATALFVYLIKKLNPAIGNRSLTMNGLQEARDDKLSEAWQQMEALNQLYDWDTTTQLVQKVIPEFQFDRYLTLNRLQDLQSNFGLSPEFNDYRSILSCQSGSFKDNPFALVRYVDHRMGNKTYYGSIVIHWTEQQRDTQGNWMTVQKSQTLTASVTKPFPMYAIESQLIYGHEAAPNLSFTRTPSKLSGLDKGSLNDWRKQRAVKGVERKASRAIRKGTSNLTLMANREFESLFKAIDRNHEVEFRLLFSPLAQQEMVKLMNDGSTGYGDDFNFFKFGKVNFISASHLNDIDIDGNPNRFASFDLANARHQFSKSQMEFFRALYFGFAPLWTIPLYQEQRSLPFVDLGPRNNDVTFWDHEAMANYIGQDNFRHPDSITANIIKTASTVGSNNTQDVSVTAFGYGGIERVDIVVVRGGDDNLHNVPVHWIEYYPVSQQSSMVVARVQGRDVSSYEEDSEIENRLAIAMNIRGLEQHSSFFRRGVVAFIQ
jgi:hypothetical protein